MALTNLEPWRYYDRASQSAALAALRASLGPSYAATPDNAGLTRALGIAVAYLERATARWFVPRAGALAVDGTGASALFLPAPVVAASQVTGGGVTAVSVEGEDLDAGSWTANEGAGVPGYDDPRDNPLLRWAGRSSWSSPWNRDARWPWGRSNVSVTATWGYLEADGSTPALVLFALSRLTLRHIPTLDDEAATVERVRGGAVVAEATRDRSYSYADAGLSAGVTGDREIDKILASYRRPPAAVSSTPPRQRRRW